MSFNKFKKKSYYVGGKQRGTCTVCKKNKSPIVSDQTIAGEGLGDFFKHIRKTTRTLERKYSIIQPAHRK